MLPFVAELANKYKLFLFDLDGTLLDSMSAWCDADSEFLGRRGFQVTDEYTEFVKRVPMEESAKYTIKKFNLDMTPDQVIAEWQESVAGKYANTIELKSGVKDFINEAKNLGIKMGVATALDHVNADGALKRHGIFGMFECVYTLSDFGGTRDKSSPDFYLAACAACGGFASSEVLVFDDVPEALKGADAGGFDTCAVFDPVGAGGKWAEMKAFATYSVEDFASRN